MHLCYHGCMNECEVVSSVFVGRRLSDGSVIREIASVHPTHNGRYNVDVRVRVEGRRLLELRFIQLEVNS